MGMIKRILLTIAVVAILITGCNESFERPKNVPQKAIWVGGSDGGVWIESISKRDSTFMLKVFSQNGALLEDAFFTMNEECKDVILNQDELAKKFSAFDGNDIILNLKYEGKFCSLVKKD